LATTCTASGGTAAACWRWWTGGLPAGTFGYKSARRHELTYLGTLTIRASGGFTAKDQFFKLAAASLTLVLENRH